MTKKYKTIDLEHHYETELYLRECNKVGFDVMDEEAARSWKGNPDLKPIHPSSPYLDGENFDEVLLELSEGRLARMDKAGVDFAQISLTSPGAEFFDGETARNIASNSNDVLAAAIKEHPDRFGGYITLAVKDPEWSIDEIDRAVELGLWGWFTQSNFNGSYLDERKYWPILEKCEKMNMPIYIHPTGPIMEKHEFGVCLEGPSLGFTVDTARCFMRMIHRGVFDAFPKLKIILGHMAEGFGFFKDRVNSAYRQDYGQPAPEVGHYDHEPSYYIEQNLWCTTSGNYLPEALYCTKNTLGIDRLTLGSDYAMEDFNLCVPFVTEDPKLTDEEKEAICFKNAQALGFGKNL